MVSVNYNQLDKIFQEIRNKHKQNKKKENKKKEAKISTINLFNATYVFNIVNKLYKIKTLNKKFAYGLWYFNLFNKNKPLDKTKHKFKTDTQNIDHIKINNIKKNHINLYNNINLYLHVPFCLNKCVFCVHNSIPLSQNQNSINLHNIFNLYFKSIKKDLMNYSKIFKNYFIKSFYLGGGSPTIFNTKDMKALLNNLKESFDFFYESEKYERTIEIALNTFNSISELKDYLNLISKYFNRISIGIQSFDKKVLFNSNRFFPDENKIKFILNYAENNNLIVSADLIFGLPFDNLNSFKQTLIKTLNLGFDEIFIYRYLYDKLKVINNLKILLNSSGNLKQDYSNYLNYSLPYSYEELIVLINEIKTSNYSNYHFNLNFLNKIIITKKNQLNNPILKSENRYLSDYSFDLNNLILGLGTLSYSVPTYYMKYIDYNNKIRFFYIPSIKHRKLFYLIYAIYDGISLNKYKQLFNSNLFDDFDLVFNYLIDNSILISEKRSNDNDTILKLNIDLYKNDSYKNTEKNILYLQIQDFLFKTIY